MKNKPIIIGILLLIVIIPLAFYFAVSTGEKEPMFFHAVVKLDPSLESDAKHLSKLFIVLYPSDYQGGPPFAAANYQLSKLPSGKLVEFAATRNTIKVMNPALNPKSFKVKAILDSDGMAGTSPGDLVGIVENVQLGSKNVEIIINQKI